MKKECEIVARGFYRETGKPVLESPKKVLIRKEFVDLDTNELFNGVETEGDIKSAYESFWNNLNPNSEVIVEVTDVIFV